MEEVTLERLKEDVLRVLSHDFWIEEVGVDEEHLRFHDDHDGGFTGRLGVSFDQVGDAWICVDQACAIRFRMDAGGGMSPRTRKALMILALAIKMDNEEHPQQVPRGT